MPKLTASFFACLVALPWAGRAAANPQVMDLVGKGVQIYRCTGAPDSAAWKFAGPEATLTTPAGQAAGHHFAGPSWQAPDGSVVVGEVIAQNAAPDAGAIPWLVLRAKSHSGSGAFATVAFVTRTHTVGGVAPGGACAAGTMLRVDYTAVYTFFR